MCVSLGDLSVTFELCILFEIQSGGRGQLAAYFSQMPLPLDMCLLSLVLCCNSGI